MFFTVEWHRASVEVLFGIHLQGSQAVNSLLVWGEPRAIKMIPFSSQNCVASKQNQAMLGKISIHLSPSAETGYTPSVG